MARHSPETPQPTLTVPLTVQDLRILTRLAYHYLRIRPVREVIRFVAPARIRARVRFVADESKWLKRFAVATRESMEAGGEDLREVNVTLRAAVAFWGRLLASLNSPRARRKLSQREVERREALAEKFQAALSRAAQRNRRMVEAELQTRRPVEEIWMRERLGLRRSQPAGP